MSMLCKKSCLGILFMGLFFYFGCASVPKDSTLAKVGDQLVTEQDLVAGLEPKAKQAYLRFKKQQLDKLVAKKLLEQEAQRRKIPYEAFLTEEVFNKAKVSHDELHAYYQKNKKQFSKKEHENWEKEVTKTLSDQKAQMVLKTLLSRLADKTDIQYYLSSVEVKDVSQENNVKKDSQKVN